MIKHLLLLCCLSLFLAASASHYRAGEITYEQLNGRLFKIKITTYSDPNSSADPSTQSIKVSFGDGLEEEIIRTSRIIIKGEIVQNTYITNHLYNSDGIFKVSFLDNYRVKSIVNINNGSTDRFPFIIYANIKINASLSANSSPILTKPPIDDGCTFNRFFHNPSAYDPDGDSLTFELTDPAGTLNYVDPIAPNGFKLGFSNGQLIWDAPQVAGIYNIAILIKEFRAGREIGFVVRDMQITIADKCPNDPPIVQNILDGCVVVGDEITRTITATDPQTFQRVNLSGFGGPFVVPALATFSPNPANGLGGVVTQFSWKPSCRHVRYSAWQVIFEAKDDEISRPGVSQNSFFVEVIAPPITNLKTTQMANGFNLTWNKDTCNLAAEYHIYRRIDSSKWNPAYCQKGIPESTGFKLIAKIPTLNNPNAAMYYDNNNGEGLSPLINYCYRVVALYPARGANGTIIFSENTLSKASAEICATQELSKPSITQVSVTKTNATLGAIEVRYIKPDFLDTMFYKAPYRFVLKRALSNSTTYTQVQTVDYASYKQVVDMVILDSLLNTQQNQYAYQVDMFAHVNGVLTFVANSSNATAIKAKIYSTDRTNILSWDVNVPWLNDTFYVFRKNNNNSFEQIGVTTKNAFSDLNLVNKQPYCYVIQSSGYYRSLNQVFKTINFSQEICGTPIDTVRPCAPSLLVIPPCGALGQFSNRLTWTPGLKCADDVVSYKIYYKQLVTDEYKLLATLPVSQLAYIDEREALKETITGCYYVAGVDSVGNESFPTNISCIENCPEYELPNVFTPNGDGKNDLFIPFPYRFVKGVNFKVFNRWGIEVFSTTNIDLLWDGTDQTSGKPLSDGVYFYTCEVEQLFLNGTQKKQFNGTIQLIR